MTEGYPPAWQYDVANEGAHAAPANEYPQSEVAETNYSATGTAADAQPGFGTNTGAGAGTDTGAEQGKTGAAKEQAAAVGQGAAQAGQQVASVAKDQVQNVAAEAGSQAKDLIDQARSELTDQAAAQQKRLAAGLRALGDELESMTHHSEQPGVATDLAKQAATRAHDTASWLDDREPGHLLQNLQAFARQKPGAFLALAAGAGLLAGRLGRGVKDAGGDDAATTATSGTDASAWSSATADAGHSAQPVTTHDAESARPFASSQDDQLDHLDQLDHQEFPAAGGSR